ncbi:hypothetical protein M0813_07342 [Anaeramoeba flamelloides]|uniref:Uncharacterized protein n=1 Tax=Anaeramoeba flamelloides TaxID=1746091 RepID=A0ABQ8XEM8_9EUKA|nr:hypothetical protein M0813_07342 [Anaeramoeba flamelloides]
MSKLVKKNKIPSRLGNRANSSNYVPNKEELEDYSLCTEKQKEELEKMKTKTLNKERFQILYDNLPELFVHEEKFVLIDKRLVNIYCVAIKNGRSNVRKTISNFYKGFLNVTPRTNKGFILLKNGTTLEEIDNCKGLKEFKEEIKGILQKPRKRKRTRKTQKKAKSIPLALKLQKPNPKKIFKNLKTSRLVPETDGEFKRRRFNRTQKPKARKVKKKRKKIIRVGRKTKIQTKTETQTMNTKAITVAKQPKTITKIEKKQPNYEIEKQAILVEKIANCFQEETDLEEQNNLFSIPNNYFDFDKEDFNFSQSDSEFSTSDYEETDDSDYQIETNITCPKSPSIFHLDSTDFNLGISEIPGLSPKEFIDFNFLHKDFMTTIGEGTLVNHTYHEDEKLYDRNIIY